MKEICSLVLANVKEFFAQYPEIETSDHGFDHACRVLNKARKIVSMSKANGIEDIDEDVAYLAAILHDVDDHKYFGTSDYANARRIMKECNVDADTIEKVVNCINQVGFSKNKFNPTDCIEAGIARDADRLDASGAFGVMRTFIYGASVGRPVEESIKHFSDKILHLHKHMCTDAGKELAKIIGKHSENFMMDLGMEYALSDGIKCYGEDPIEVADNLIKRYARR